MVAYAIVSTESPSRVGRHAKAALRKLIPFFGRGIG